MSLPRIRTCLLLVLAPAAAACDAGITTGPPLEAIRADGGGFDPADPGATLDGREVFEASVQPLLLTECGRCHGDATMGVGFLEGPDTYARILAWPGLVVPGEPASSALLTKGPHAGPAPAAATSRTAAAWIELEGAAPADPGPDEDPGPGADPGPGGNMPPRAIFAFTPGDGESALSLDASMSSDPDGSVVSYTWSYGDGSTGTGPTVEHVYPGPDTYAVRLTVTDDYGDTAVATQVIEVGSGLPQVLRLVLVDADSDTDVPTHTPLVNGADIDLAAIGTSNLSIRADTSPAEVGSLRFSLDADANFNTESNAPYALAGDSGGDYEAWVATPGEHIVSATAYTEDDAGGTAGPAFTVRFTVR